MIQRGFVGLRLERAAMSRLAFGVTLDLALPQLTFTVFGFRVMLGWHWEAERKLRDSARQALADAMLSATERDQVRQIVAGLESPTMVEETFRIPSRCVLPLFHRLARAAGLAGGRIASTERPESDDLAWLKDALRRAASEDGR